MASTRHTPCPTPFSDHVVKSPHGVDVGVRVWPAEGKQNAPWLFWIHGGGFTAGYHLRGASWMHTAFGERGWHVVSVAYRFCPQVTFREQIQDVADAWTWCHTHLPTVLGEGSIRLADSVVAGDSAGGFHTLYAGLTFSPAPRVLVPLYAPCNWLDPKFVGPTKVDPSAPPAPPASSGSSSESAQVAPVGVDKFRWYADRPDTEYTAALADRDPLNARTFSPWWWDLEAPVEDLQRYFGLPNWRPSDDDFFRMDLYKYGAKTKARFPATHRQDTFASPEEYAAYIRSVNPLDILQTKETFPPTILLHGDADSAVPVSQSEDWAKALEAKGVPVELLICPAGGHSFDETIQKPGDKGWDEYIAPMIAFVDKHLAK